MKNGINILLGTSPKEIPRGLSLFDQIESPNIPAGFPSELLNRRPDIFLKRRENYTHKHLELV